MAWVASRGTAGIQLAKVGTWATLEQKAWAMARACQGSHHQASGGSGERLKCCEIWLSYCAVVYDHFLQGQPAKLIMETQSLPFLGTMSKVQCLKKRKSLTKGGGGVKASVHTLFSVWETLIFFLNFLLSHAQLLKN